VSGLPRLDLAATERKCAGWGSRAPLLHISQDSLLLGGRESTPGAAVPEGVLHDHRRGNDSDIVTCVFFLPALEGVPKRVWLFVVSARTNLVKDHHHHRGCMPRESWARRWWAAACALERSVARSVAP
jgi:hypothetical protein